MPIRKPIEELELLDRIDRRWRNGEFQEAIAQAEGWNTAGALHTRLARLGFRFSRIGGPHLVTTLDGRSYAEMRERGEIMAAEDRVPA